MRLEYYPAEKLKTELLSIFAKYIDLTGYRIFFFGSRVMGKGTERSDIDVCIEGPPLPPHVVSEIQEEAMNLRMLYKIDIVDFSAVSEKFRSVVGNRREYITH